MVQTRAEPARDPTSTSKRRAAWPRDVAFGILVGIVAAGVLWLILAVIFRHLVG